MQPRYYSLDVDAKQTKVWKYVDWESAVHPLNLNLFRFRLDGHRHTAHSSFTCMQLQCV